MSTTRALLNLCPRRVLTGRGYATVRQDLQGLYNLPKPPSAVRPRPPPPLRRRTPASTPTAERVRGGETDVQRRRWLLGTAAIGAGALIYLLTNEPTHKTEAPASSSPGDFDPAVPVALQPGDGLVDSGTASVPPFPTRVTAPGDGGEYAFVGLGIRTVSFLAIQVYVVGFYVHVDDLAAVQAALVASVHPGASSATAAERDALRTRLLHPVDSESLWEDVLNGSAKFRSLFRIVPTRNTGSSPLLLPPPPPPPPPPLLLLRWAAAAGTIG